jgi:enoyl-CoA hydratase
MLKNCWASNPNDAGRKQIMSVTVEKKGPVCTVVLSRADVRNAVDGPTAAALADAFREFDADAVSKVGVLYGENGHFCAGADLKAVASGENQNRIEPEGDGPMGPSRMILSKPVIAAIAGYAVAGGLELALWCDLRVVEEDAVMGVFCRRWGVPLIDGGTVRLPRLVGMGRALDLILTGRPVVAQEALEMGLANRIVPKGAARAEAEKLALQIADFPEVCMREDRASVYEQYHLPLEQALENEFKHGRISIQHVADGIRRFNAGEGRHGAFNGGTGS